MLRTPQRRTGRSPLRLLLQRAQPQTPKAPERDCPSACGHRREANKHREPRCSPPALSGGSEGLNYSLFWGLGLLDRTMTATSMPGGEPPPHAQTGTFWATPTHYRGSSQHAHPGLLQPSSSCRFGSLSLSNRQRESRRRPATPESLRGALAGDEQPLRSGEPAVTAASGRLEAQQPPSRSRLVHILPQRLGA